MLIFPIQLDANKPAQRISELKGIVMDMKLRFEELSKTIKLIK